MSKPAHVHLRLSIPLLRALDSWAMAHEINRNEAANRLLERILGGEETGQIQRTIMLSERLAASLHELGDTISDNAFKDSLALRHIVARQALTDVISTEVLFLMRAWIAAREPQMFRQVQPEVERANKDAQRQLKRDLTSLGLDVGLLSDPVASNTEETP